MVPVNAKVNVELTVDRDTKSAGGMGSLWMDSGSRHGSLFDARYRAATISDDFRARHMGPDNITGEYHGRFFYVGQSHHMGCVLGFDIPVAQFSHLHDFPSSDQEDEREGAREEKNENPIAELSISSPALSQGTRLSARRFVFRANG
jgi:hypothetical protein